MPAQGELRGPRAGGGDWDTHASDVDKPANRPADMTAEQLARSRARQWAAATGNRQLVFPIYATCRTCRGLVQRAYELEDGYVVIRAWQHYHRPLPGRDPHHVETVYFEEDQ